MVKQFWGTCGLVPGSLHVQKKTNNQDQVFFGEIQYREEPYRFGFSLDGCGSGLYSEFGVIAMKQFLIYEIPRLIRLGINLENIQEILFQSIVREIIRQLPVYLSVEELCDFIEENFYFTLFGFIQGPEQTTVFWIGDGVVYLNGKVIIGKEKKTKQNNHPDYLARVIVASIDPYYFTRKYGRKLGWSANKIYQPKAAFDALLLETAGIDRLAVGSDAWHDEDELLDQLWNFDQTYPQELQEQMNAWSGQPYRPQKGVLHFEDDASIAILQAILDNKDVQKEESE